MPKFIVEVTITKTEIYHVEAADKDEALELYGLGNYVSSRDEQGDLIEVREMES